MTETINCECGNHVEHEDNGGILIGYLVMGAINLVVGIGIGVLL